MENEFFDLPIKQTLQINTEDLRISKAKDFALALTAGNYNVLCCKIIGGDGGLFNVDDEVVIFDINLDISQRVVNDIRYTERIAVLFPVVDNVIPWVFALRKSFPLVLHRHSMYFESPVCLCVYEQGYEELKLEWRSQKFIDDIRNWLVLTSQGALHQVDQPLEPFLIFNDGRILLSNIIGSNEPVYIYLINQIGNSVNLVANHVHHQRSEFHYLFLKGEPQEHGIIHKSPGNLYDLYEFLLRAGIDLLRNLYPIITGEINNKVLVNKRLLLVVQLPKRAVGSDRLEHDLYCFITHDNLKTIGVYQNFILEAPDGSLGLAFPRQDADTSNASKLKISILIPYINLSKHLALIYSGNKHYKNIQQVKICQIGAGALGSELFLNMTKSGIGTWCLIDEDIILPHNLVRHQLGNEYILNSKAEALSKKANSLVNDQNFSTGMWANYFSSGQAIESALTEAEIILDVSTSIPLARNLSNRTDLKARKISIFFNPTGTDLVILAEDKRGEIKLDALEFQYYRNLLDNNALDGHLAQPEGLRYSNSCRDITTLISSENVNILGSIASGMLKRIMTNDDALVSIWRIDQDSYSVEKTILSIERYHVLAKNDWTIVIDEFVLNKIFEARAKKLPVETGGILIGGYDFERKKIFVVDTILSPKDSEEKRTSYIRGIEGVKDMLSDIELKTAGHLKYIGEWHSHPEKCSLYMSDDDVQLFSELESEMYAVGYPPLMLIAGDDKYFHVYTSIE